MGAILGEQGQEVSSIGSGPTLPKFARNYSEREMKLTVNGPAIISSASGLASIGFTLSDLEAGIRVTGGLLFIVTGVISLIYMIRNQHRKERSDRRGRHRE